jgi:uncharacterized protein (TIGR00304 family)
MKSRLSKFAIPITLFVSGLALLAYSAFEGSLQVTWVLIIPVFSGTGIFAFLGTLLIIVGIILFFLVYLKGFTDQYEPARGGQGNVGQPPTRTAQPQGASKKFGGVVLVGPIPVIFGSDPKLTIVIVVLAIILIVVTLLLLAFYLRP